MPNENPKVTVLIPTYNRARLLKRSMLSVLEQDYRALTLLVCDNASTDQTPSVVRKIQEKDPRVQYHRHATNLGVYQNFQFAKEQVKTPYFCLLCDDDLWLPNFLSTVMPCFSQFPKLGFVASAVFGLTEWGQVILKKPSMLRSQEIYHPPQGVIGLIKHGLKKMGIWPGMVFRSDAAGIQTPFLQNEDHAFDLEFNLRIALYNPILLLKPVGALYVVHGFSDQEKVIARISALGRILKSFPIWFDLPKQIGRKYQAISQDSFAYFITSAWRKAVMQNDFLLAKKYIAVGQNDFEESRSLTRLQKMTTTFLSSPKVFSYYQLFQKSLTPFRKRRFKKWQEEAEQFLSYLKKPKV